MSRAYEAVSKVALFFRSGKSKDIRYRKESLERLRDNIRLHAADIEKALSEDLGKSPQEAYMTETGMVLESISFMSRNIRRLSKPRKAAASMAQMPGRCRIHPEPYGTVLVMSPWNYPLLLTLDPLIAAVAAGNCVVVKPSAYSPATSRLLGTIISETFEEGHVTLLEGGREVNGDLLEQHFDYIFFTGGKTVGRLVMEKASRNLTPVTLELGGKSPVLVCEDADLKLCARQVAFGKCLNCGQTCVAPDYVLINEKDRDKFVSLYVSEVRKMYGDSPLTSPDYGKIINRKHFDRLSAHISAAAKGENGSLAYGGETIPESLKIAPAVLVGVTGESPIMNEEIFGPVLPIMTYRTEDEAVSYILSGEKPLAAYIFTSDRKKARKLIGQLPYGGGCINDTIMHLASTKIPFGGVGESGMGAYHGRWGFETFTHYKSIFYKNPLLDLPLRYAPFSETKKRIASFFLK